MYNKMPNLLYSITFQLSLLMHGSLVLLLGDPLALLSLILSGFNCVQIL